MEDVISNSSENFNLNKVVEVVKTPVVEASGNIKLVMALTVNPKNEDEGLIRVITSRKGSAAQHGSVDRSLLYKVTRTENDNYEIDKELEIENQKETITEIEEKTGWEFKDLEDPDIEIDENGLAHIYFTMVFRDESDDETYIYLGHAEGDDLDSLKMTDPVLAPVPGKHWGAKEVSIAPKNSQGKYLNLVESSDETEKTKYSVVRLAEAASFNGQWEYKGIVLHPKDLPAWAAGHASPGQMLSRKFIDVGSDKCVVILNGRAANKVVDGKTKYRDFTVGVMIYNYEIGKVEWVSPEPLIKDPAAVTVTFASEFIEQDYKGILYAHVDDSFVRKYIVDVIELEKWIADSTV